MRKLNKADSMASAGAKRTHFWTNSYLLHKRPQKAFVKRRYNSSLSHSRIRFLNISRKAKTFQGFFWNVKIPLTSDNTAAIAESMLISLAAAGLPVFQVLILRQ